MIDPTDMDEERHRQTLEALADIDAGRVIEHEKVVAWADSLARRRVMPSWLPFQAIPWRGGS